MKKVLFVPIIKKNSGTGHLKRTIKWAKSTLYQPFIYIPENYPDKNNSDKNYPGSSDFDNSKSNMVSKENFSAIPGLKEIEKSIVLDLSGKYYIAIFDMRKTDPALVKEIEKSAKILVSVDEGGENRKNFDYLIDTLPNTVSKTAQPNIFSTDLLGYEDKRNIAGAGEKTANQQKKYSNILISFGGEDSKDITKKFLDKAQKKNIFKNINVTVVIGPFFKNKSHIKENFSFFNIIESPSSLSKLIEESDLVFTSFGLTAYEALYAGKDVLLINPTKYHRKLSRLACFCEAGIINPNIKKIEKIIKNPALCSPMHSKKPLNNPAREKDVTLKIDELFLKIAETEKISCPVCKEKGEIYKRYIHKNYLKCKKCSIIYLQNIGKNKKEYGKSYFFEEYKKQYGKTYIEDFHNISAISQKRADIIKKIVKKGTALDIGCAYGPFLYVMKDQYNCYGIDISEHAVEYVNKNLGIKAAVMDFSLTDSTPVFDELKDELKGEIKDESKFDIITMWYVIEHFKNTGEIIEKVGKLLNKSGIFAFSTPNSSGISSTYNKNKFLESSPSDHYTVWNISSAKHILSQFGFKVIKVRSTGHHPERFPLILQKILGLKILSLISKIFRFGDTFEIYAIKAGHCAK